MKQIHRLAVTAFTTLMVVSVSIGAANAGDATFPAGTKLSNVGLPMYPAPKNNIMVLPNGTTGDGAKSETIKLDPHESLSAVVDWYKARMPAGTQIPSADPTHASFQIGKSGDKVIRMVILDHNTGQVQTNILLMRHTLP